MYHFTICVPLSGICFTGAKQDAEEETPLGQLAQQAQHAKHRKVQIADDQGPVKTWGCYKAAEHVGQLMRFMNARGIAAPKMTC